LTTRVLIVAIAVPVLFAAVSIVAFVIWRSTNNPDPDQTREIRVYSRREGGWLLFVLTSMFVILVGTIWFTPYGAEAQTPNANTQVVNVVGQQFGWQITPATVKTGMPVLFYVTSKDVTHGFGVFNSGGYLLFQIQDLPGYTNKVEYTFSSAGTYTVRCLEYCGIDHHKMISTIKVVAAPSAAKPSS
jgi:cytochrome c oxidase subunit II